MAIQVIASQKGPLPISAAFKAPSDAPMYLEVSGSVWTETANSMIGIEVHVDNQLIGFAQIYSNANETHRAVVPAYLPIELPEGKHTLVLKTVGGSKTVSDSNDFYVAVLHY